MCIPAQIIYEMLYDLVSLHCSVGIDSVSIVIMWSRASKHVLMGYIFSEFSCQEYIYFLASWIHLLLDGKSDFFMEHFLFRKKNTHHINCYKGRDHLEDNHESKLRSRTSNNNNIIIIQPRLERTDGRFNNSIFSRSFHRPHATPLLLPFRRCSTQRKPN